MAATLLKKGEKMHDERRIWAKRCREDEASGREVRLPRRFFFVGSGRRAEGVDACGRRNGPSFVTLKEFFVPRVKTMINHSGGGASRKKHIASDALLPSFQKEEETAWERKNAIV